MVYVASRIVLYAALTASVQTALVMPWISADSPDTSVSVCVHESSAFCTDDTHCSTRLWNERDSSVPSSFIIVAVLICRSLKSPTTSSLSSVIVLVSAIFFSPVCT
eukprot:GHVR01098295.1.p1 GENE.GHVR01098295.1~~GHVR01098295.1.p1  ORF type:complete len:106 (+),score=3.94 GHVR01098295.1:64-381(+)